MFLRYRIVFFVVFVVEAFIGGFSGVVISLDVHGGAAFLGEDWVYLVGSVRIRFK